MAYRHTARTLAATGLAGAERTVLAPEAGLHQAAGITAGAADRAPPRLLPWLRTRTRCSGRAGRRW